MNNKINVCIRAVGSIINGICYLFNRMIECCRGKAKAKEVSTTPVVVKQILSRGADFEPSNSQVLDSNMDFLGELQRIRRAVQFSSSILTIDEMIRKSDVVLAAVGKVEVFYVKEVAKNIIDCYRHSSSLHDPKLEEKVKELEVWLKKVS